MEHVIFVAVLLESESMLLLLSSISRSFWESGTCVITHTRQRRMKFEIILISIVPDYLVIYIPDN